MFELILMFILCSLWGIIVVDEFQPFQQIKEKIGLGTKRKLFSGYIVVDYIIFLIYKVINCPMCLSYHFFWITYLIVYGSVLGIFLGAISYFLTFYIKKTLLITI